MKNNKGLIIALNILLVIAILVSSGIIIKKNIDDRNEELRQQEIAQQEQAKKEKIKQEQEIREQRAKEQQKLIEKQQRDIEQLAEDNKQRILNQWNLILVNNTHPIPDGYKVERANVIDGFEVDNRIQSSLTRMLEDCSRAGREHSPKIVSAYRTFETQQQLYNSTANKNDTALPGHSEHEIGLAVDIVDEESLEWKDPLVEKQAETETQKWLMAHCHEYGFILRYPKNKQDITGIIYEPWHYRYVGGEHAEKIMTEGLCLEEYLEQIANQ